MPHDPVLVADTRAWLRKVDVDPRSATVDLNVEPPILEDVLFHAQQAVEKVLKAFLTWHQKPFGKTHDLRNLVKLVSGIGAALESELTDAIPLTACAWKFRYPGLPEEPSLGEAKDALDTA